ncbi:protein LBH [Brachyhypopomus gauderio]|uniref:protein LBH n=1 Tax=Brachyhypopomus gauderio TaxID=698409 RepID=UPI0040417B05
MSVYCPQVYCPVFLPCREMTDVMISSSPIEDMLLSAGKDGNTFQIFPGPSDFEHSRKQKHRLPSIVVQVTEGEVESGELRWPPEEYIISTEEDKEAREQEDGEDHGGQAPEGQHVQNSHHYKD